MPDRPTWFPDGPGAAWSAYIHIPYCASRCGYCDFNTYAPDQLAPSTQPDYVRALTQEFALARDWLTTEQPISTVFFGGGTPTMLDAEVLTTILAELGERFDISPDAEITTEANPETLTPAYLEQLLAGGFNRISIGMQSAVSHVLGTLDRRHTAGRAVQVAHDAARAGFTEISLDLIYGTPGESLADWQHSLDSALDAPITHMSAYSLIVEPGTRLARQVKRAEIPAPQSDDQADKYLLAEEMLTSAGFENYETSNWARPGSECRHNLAYWRSADWWGFGAGAHSHVNGVRWYNVKHPLRYQRELPAIADYEALTVEQRHMERVMLGLRLAEGVPMSELTSSELGRLDQLRDSLETLGERVVVREDHRLVADAVIRDLLD